MIDEKKLIDILSKNSVFAKITNAEGKNVFDIISELVEDTKEENEKCSNCSRRKFYQEGYVDGLKANKWIPCSERLPDEGNEFYPMCIVTLDNGDVCLGVYRHDDKEWLTRMSEGEIYYSAIHKVIAWQPLPEAYKELEND